MGTDSQKEIGVAGKDRKKSTSSQDEHEVEFPSRALHPNCLEILGDEALSQASKTDIIAKSKDDWSPENFDFLTTLGKGISAKVMLAKSKTSGKIFAVKMIKKELLIKNGEVSSAFNEKHALRLASASDHSFIAKLYATQQTTDSLYLYLEYCCGGDLLYHLQKAHFDMERSRFYAAEVVLALKWLHEQSILYRNVKLENVLLDSYGHVKLIGFGYSKLDMGYGKTTGTFCGTAEFLAPEILLDKPYTRAIDFWALGVLLYQMLLREQPFRGEDEDEIYDAILQDDPVFSEDMSRDATSLMRELLQKEPENRLGSGLDGVEKVMAHEWFATINWNELLSRRVTPTFVPASWTSDIAETSNFGYDSTGKSPNLTQPNPMLSDVMQEQFRGFDWSSE